MGHLAVHANKKSKFLSASDTILKGSFVGFIMLKRPFDKDPLKIPHLYSKTGGFHDIPFFLFSVLDHRLCLFNPPKFFLF